MVFSTHLRTPDDPSFKILAKFVANAVNLTRLHLDCVLLRGEGPERIAAQFHLDAYQWLEAVGREKGRRDAAAQIVELGDSQYQILRRSSEWWQRRPLEKQEMQDRFRAALSRLLTA